MTDYPVQVRPDSVEDETRRSYSYLMRKTTGDTAYNFRVDDVDPVNHVSRINIASILYTYTYTTINPPKVFYLLIEGLPRSYSTALGDAYHVQAAIIQGTTNGEVVNGSISAQKDDVINLGKLTSRLGKFRFILKKENPTTGHLEEWDTVSYSNFQLRLYYISNRRD